MTTLKITNPIAFFDLETTGVNVASDRIVEISILKLLPNGNKEIKTKRINPTIPIPIQSSLIHGIYDADVVNEPTFKGIAKSLAVFLQDCDLAGYNSNRFDIPVLMEEFLRAEVDFDLKGRKFVDVQNIFHQMEQRTLKAAYKFYCDKPLINAHSAEADTEATYEIFLAQLEKYKDTVFEDKQGNESIPIKNDIAALHDFTNINKCADLAGRIVFNEEGIEVFNFGKHTGKSVQQILKDEPSYYNWMMNGDFPLYTKKVLTDIKLRTAFNR
ncbi:MAG: exonuclease domain-containing protein [Bacteroidia bacterium]